MVCPQTFVVGNSTGWKSGPILLAQQNEQICGDIEPGIV